MLKYILIFLLLIATTGYTKTITVNDLAGRQVTISTPVEKILLTDSMDIQALDIVSGDRYFDHIVGWSDVLKQFFPDVETAYFNKYPQLKNIPVIGKNAVNISSESIIKLNPDLVIARVRSYHDFKERGILQNLQAAGINIVFIDFRSRIPEHVVKSIEILGRVLDNQQRAQSYIKWHQEKINYIKNKVSHLDNKTTLLIEKNAGLYGKDATCCTYYGSETIGSLAELAGGNNLLAGIVPKNGGQSSLETVLQLNPRHYILSGADWSRYNKDMQSVIMGYNKNKNNAASQLKALTERKGIALLQAVKSQHVMVVYHGFYDHPLNVLIIEAIAKFLYPDTFSELDPDADLQYLHKNFISIAADGIFWLTL